MATFISSAAVRASLAASTKPGPAPSSVLWLVARGLRLISTTSRTRWISSPSRIHPTSSEACTATRHSSPPTYKRPSRPRSCCVTDSVTRRMLGQSTWSADTRRSAARVDVTLNDSTSVDAAAASPAPGSYRVTSVIDSCGVDSALHTCIGGAPRCRPRDRGQSGAVRAPLAYVRRGSHGALATSILVSWATLATPARQARRTLPCTACRTAAPMVGGQTHGSAATR